MDTPGKLKISIGGAKDLGVGDSQVSYVLIRVGINQFRTQEQCGSSPVWDESFNMKIKADRTMEVLVVNADDEEIMARGTLSLATVKVNGSDARDTPLTQPEGGAKCGTLSVSLAFEAGAAPAAAPRPAAASTPAAAPAAAPAAPAAAPAAAAAPAPINITVVTAPAPAAPAAAAAPAAPAYAPAPYGYPAPPPPGGYPGGYPTGYPAPYGAAPPPPAAAPQTIYVESSKPPPRQGPSAGTAAAAGMMMGMALGRATGPRHTVVVRGGRRRMLF